ncbi:hypothetical protein NT6N_28880 [Oceaniferula spumae]|uniref:Uncharacterized protein n=1 Tax=Oceaniferula spumae TaxID=2979115 RepID=A0AAT9FPE3_9BACT
MKKLTLLLLLCCLPLAARAGSRGLDIAFIDATPAHTTAEGKRLAELLVMDMKKLYSGDQVGKLFPWSENTVDLKVLHAEPLGLSFDNLINIKNPKKIGLMLAKNRVSDGLIVFYYDRTNGVARLKLFDGNGFELLLLRLPLEGKNSAMKYSILKGNRLGALAAVGANVRWSP